MASTMGCPMTTFRLSLAFFALALAGCDCAGPSTPCSSDGQCPAGFRCTDGLCMERSDGGDGDGGLVCSDGRERCGAVCCGDDAVCNAGVCALDCGSAPVCGGACCEGGEECVDDRCVVECADESRRCGSMGELCCSAEQACLGQACVALGAPCEFTEEC